MSFMVIFGLFVIVAYLFQLLLGLRQLKHFNAVYASLRRQGRVAIGRRAGKSGPEPLSCLPWISQVRY